MSVSVSVSWNAGFNVRRARRHGYDDVRRWRRRITADGARLRHVLAAVTSFSAAAAAAAAGDCGVGLAASRHVLFSRPWVDRRKPTQVADGRSYT